MEVILLALRSSMEKQRLRSYAILIAFLIGAGTFGSLVGFNIGDLLFFTAGAGFGAVMVISNALRDMKSMHDIVFDTDQAGA